MHFGGVAGHISSLQIARFSRSGHRVSVPVRPSQTVFAQYRYISGTPASSGQRTVPLSRLQLLNSLINNLQKMKTDAVYDSGAAGSSPERTDALIKQYAAELHQAMKSVPESFGTLGGSAEAGMVFNIAV
jgi:hypothetical protein